MLTKKQKHFFDRLKSFIDSYGYFPSFREIASYTGLSSTNSVWKYMKKLEAEGFVKFKDGKYSLVKESSDFFTIPLVGFVPAGFPFEIFSELGEEIELPYWFVGPNNKDIVAFKVKGLSMKDAYINDGDIVILKRTEDVHSGDTIIAILDDGSITLKKLKILKNSYLLIPENPEYKPIKTKELKIVGKVIGVLRKYE